MSSAFPPCAVVVDDDAIILIDVTAILEDAGFRVFTASGAEEALQHLVEQAGEIALLFTDVEMPGMDGFALARHTVERWPDTAVLVASGRRSPKPGELPNRATFIAKPFSAGVVYQHLHLIMSADCLPEPLHRRQG